MNPAEKLQQIFQDALGKNNPDADRLTEAFLKAFGHSLDFALVKYEEALHNQQAAIASLQSIIRTQDYIVREQQTNIAQKVLENQWLKEKVAGKNIEIEGLKLLESDVLFLRGQVLNKVRTRPIEETTRLLLKQLERDESQETQSLRHLNDLLIAGHAALYDEFLSFIQMASENVVVQSNRWQAALSAADKVLSDQSVLLGRLKGINDQHLKKQEKIDDDLENARKAKLEVNASIKNDLKEYWQEHIDSGKKATDAAILLERTDIWKKAKYKKRSTLEHYVREWQKELGKKN